MATRKTDEPRDRFDLRIEPGWLDRVERQAKRHGLKSSAYIRLAVTLKLEVDEATDPSVSRKGKR